MEQLGDLLGNGSNLSGLTREKLDYLHNLIMFAQELLWRGYDIFVVARKRLGLFSSRWEEAGLISKTAKKLLYLVQNSLCKA